MAAVVGSVGGCALTLTNASQTRVSSRVWVRREDGGLLGKMDLWYGSVLFPYTVSLGDTLGLTGLLSFGIA